MDDKAFLAVAIEEAKKSYTAGGIPVSFPYGQHHGGRLMKPSSIIQIGACLVSKDGQMLGRGHNRRIQEGSAIKHVWAILPGGHSSPLENRNKIKMA